MSKLSDDIPIEFLKSAQQHLLSLQKIIDGFDSEEIVFEQVSLEITEILKQLKTDAGNFQYILIGHLLNIVLTFVEGIKEIDEHVIAFMQTSQKLLTIVVSQNIRDDGGELGKELETELKAAAKRYFERH